jgi:hypothetical protein
MRYGEYLLLALGGAVAVYAASPETRDLVPVQLGDITELAQTSSAAPAQDGEDVEFLLKACDREARRAGVPESQRTAKCAELVYH